jgi:hypothetical protein
MACNYQGKIVTNGLVLCLDAADKKSYPGTGTVWTDRSGNGYNGTLVDGPTFNSSNGGSIVFDGANDRVSRSSSIDTGQNFTVSAWIYPTALGTTRRSIVSNSYNYISRNGWFFCTAGGSINNTFFLTIGADLAGRVAIANTLNLNEWVYLSAICENGGSNIILYKNAQEVTGYGYSLLLSGTMTYTYPQLNVGYRDVGGSTDPYTGNIAQTTIYNRVLTQKEIQQNFNATRGRFGI